MGPLADGIQNKVSYFLASAKDEAHELQNNVVIPQSPLDTTVNFLALIVIKSFNCMSYGYSQCCHSKKEIKNPEHQNSSPPSFVLPPPSLPFPEVCLPKPRQACINSISQTSSISLKFKLDQNAEDAKNQQSHESAKDFVINDKFIPERVKIRMPGKKDPVSGKLLPLRVKRTKIRSVVKNFSGMTVSVASCTGARKIMQDAAKAAHDTIQIAGKPCEFKLWGVFDGHGERGGHIAARFVEDNVVKYLKMNLVECNKQGLTEQGIHDALERCCQMLDENYQGSNGTTALIVLQIAKILWVANVGDSRALVVKNGKTLQISEDAKPEISKFGDKIRELGGYVTCVEGIYRVNGNLATARAIGDKDITSDGATCCISHEPVVTSYSMDDLIDAYLLIATDGLFDVGSTNEIGDAISEMVAKRTSLKKMCERLVYTALMNGTQDNVSVLMTKLSDKPNRVSSKQN